jgi:ligand-binding sensor domain-containing protein
VVDHIFKDSKGFMWFTSHDGINRFDGTTCLSNEQIGPGFEGVQQTKGLVEDDKGNIWIGISSGLLKFSYHTGRFQKIVPQIISPEEKGKGTSLYYPIDYADGWLLVFRDNIPTIFYHTLTTETRLVTYPYFGVDGKIVQEKVTAIKALAPHMQSILSNSDKVSLAKIEQDDSGDFYWREHKIFDKRKNPELSDNTYILLRDSFLLFSGANGHLVKFNINTDEKVVIGIEKGLFAPQIFIDDRLNLWLGSESGSISIYDLNI